MADYTENFTSTTGDTIDASELETEFDAIATAIATKLDSDGSGTMSGDLAMGNNNITGLADPTAAQEAATKAYVDSQIATELNEMIVVDRVALATTTVTTSEVSESEISITIPADWTTYDIEISGAGYLNESTTLTSPTNITLRLRDGSGTSGTVLNTVISSMYATAGFQNTAAVSVFGFQEAETTTGSITITLTSEASAESTKVSLTGFNWQVRARRVT